MKGEIHQYADELELARETLKESLQLFNSIEIENKDHAYACKHMGITLLKLGDDANALAELEKAHHLLEKSSPTAMSIQEVLFWKRRISPLKLQEEVFLRSHPSFSLISQTMEKYPLAQDAKYLAKWMTPYIVDFKHTSMGLEKILSGDLKNVTEISYQEFLNKNSHSMNTLDLAGNILWKFKSKEKDPWNSILLSEIQGRLLYALVSTSLTGISENQLMDFIFQENFVNYESAKDRLKKAVKTLKALDSSSFTIVKERGNYKWIGHQGAIRIFIPLNFRGQGIHHYLKEALPKIFTCEQLAKKLKISSKQSYRLIEKLRADSLIQKVKAQTQGKKATYQLLNEV